MTMIADCLRPFAYTTGVLIVYVGAITLCHQYRVWVFDREAKRLASGLFDRRRILSRLRIPRLY